MVIIKCKIATIKNFIATMKRFLVTINFVSTIILTYKVYYLHNAIYY